jgi:hypothetical protein
VLSVITNWHDQTTSVMDAFGDETLSFIVKIWLEHTAGEAGQVVWRGHITHVPSGTRRHVQSKEALFAFIDTYLSEMGAETGA